MSSIFIYALAGALAGAAFFIVFRPLAPPIRRLAAAPQWQSNGPTVLGALAAAVVFAAVTMALSGGKNTANETTILNEYQSSRFVQVLEKYRPETRDRIAAIVHNAVAQNNPDLAQLQLTQLLQEYFPQYVRRTSDDAIVAFGVVLADIFSYFETNNTEICKGLATGGSLAKGLDEKRSKAAFDAMANVIEDGATKPQDPPDPAKAQALVSQVIEKLYASNDANLLPLAALATPQTAPADKLCHTMSSFYRTVLALPKADASVVLRKLVSSTQ